MSRQQVTRQDLVSALQILLQIQHLRVARSLTHAPVLVKERENYKARVTTTAREETVESWREGAHDDLVLALALAAWLGELAIPCGSYSFGR